MSSNTHCFCFYKPSADSVKKIIKIGLLVTEEFDYKKCILALWELRSLHSNKYNPNISHEGTVEILSQPVSCALSIFKLTDGTYAYRIPNGFEKLFHAKLLDSVGGTNEVTGG